MRLGSIALFAFCVVTCGAPAAHAQVSARSEIAFGGGVALTQVREDLLAPIRRVGPGVLLDGGYAWESDSIEAEGRLRLATSFVFDRFGELGVVPTLALSGKLHARVARPEIGVVRLGGVVFAREILAYYSQWDDTHLYWLGIMGIGPSAQLVTPARKRREVLIEASLPIVAFVTRPPLHRDHKADDLVDAGFWLGRIGASPEITSLHELVSLNARAVWRGATDGWWIDPWAMIELDHFSEPAPFTHLAMWLGIDAKVLR